MERREIRFRKASIKAQTVVFKYQEKFPYLELFVGEIDEGTIRKLLRKYETGDDIIIRVDTIQDRLCTRMFLQAGRTVEVMSRL